MIATILAASNAGVQRLQSMRGHFKDPDPQAPLSILVAVLAIFAIFLIMRILYRMQNRRLDAAKAQPMALYWRVQARMGIPLLDRWRLWRLAKAAGLHNPTALLISPVLFDRAAETYPVGSGQSVQLANIRKRLFGRAAPPPLESVATG
jgi:hypothetical protein